MIHTISLFLSPDLKKSFTSKQYDLITFSRGYFSKENILKKAKGFNLNFEEVKEFGNFIKLFFLSLFSEMFY